MVLILVFTIDNARISNNCNQGFDALKSKSKTHVPFHFCIRNLLICPLYMPVFQAEQECEAG
jgi:hypothetical protein